MSGHLSLATQQTIHILHTIFPSCKCLGLDSSGKESAPLDRNKWRVSRNLDLFSVMNWSIQKATNKNKIMFLNLIKYIVIISLQFKLIYLHSFPLQSFLQNFTFFLYAVFFNVGCAHISSGISEGDVIKQPEQHISPQLQHACRVVTSVLKYTSNHNTTQHYTSWACTCESVTYMISGTHTARVVERVFPHFRQVLLSS